PATASTRPWRASSPRCRSAAAPSSPPPSERGRPARAMTAAASLTFRDEPRAADLARVRELVEATGFFSGEESAVAVELLDDRLAKGPASDYRFLFGEDG